MNRRILGIALVATLAAGLGAAPATAATAPRTSATLSTSATTSASVPTAKKVARLTVSKTRTSTRTAPYALTTTYRLPVLSGSTAKNRALVTAHAKKLVAAERAAVTTWRTSCGGTLPATLQVTDVSAAVHKNRYASVTMAFTTDAGCGGVGQQSARSFTLDLTTGTRVKLSKFAAHTAGVTRLAILAALREQNPDCVYPDLTAHRGTSGLPTPDAWNVSAAGVRVWFNRYAVAPGACGAVSALVPWADVTTASHLKGKRVTRVYVNALERDGYGYTGHIAVLTVQGRQVALLEGYLFSEAYCSLGLRSGADVRRFGTYDAARGTLRLTGTTAKPGLALGKGWREATAAELKGLRAADIGTDALTSCAV